eukprot:g4799.t1
MRFVPVDWKSCFAKTGIKNVATMLTLVPPMFTEATCHFDTGTEVKKTLEENFKCWILIDILGALSSECFFWQKVKKDQLLGETTHFCTGSGDCEGTTSIICLASKSPSG